MWRRRASYGKKIAHIIDLCMQDIGKYNSRGEYSANRCTREENSKKQRIYSGVQ